jgi:hypothetical protein
MRIYTESRIRIGNEFNWDQLILIQENQNSPQKKEKNIIKITKLFLLSEEIEASSRRRKNKTGDFPQL